MTRPDHSRVLTCHYFGRKLEQNESYDQHHPLDNAPHALRRPNLKTKGRPSVLAGVKARPSQRKYKEDKKIK